MSAIIVDVHEGQASRAEGRDGTGAVEALRRRLREGMRRKQQSSEQEFRAAYVSVLDNGAPYDGAMVLLLG
jgi:hypothetical protein